MKAVSRKTLAAALSLGAAVFAWPVQAFECLDARDMGVKPDRPYSQIADLIVQLGKERISKAKVIFRGRPISATPLRQSHGSDFQDFVLTYKVSEWRKGHGKAHAKLLRTVWCDGKCNSPKIMADFMRQNEERIYIATSFSTGGSAERLPKDLDGEISICAYRDAMPPIGIELPRKSHLNHRSFLFLLSTTEELEKIPARIP